MEACYNLRVRCDLGVWTNRHQALLGLAEVFGVYCPWPTAYVDLLRSYRVYLLLGKQAFCALTFNDLPAVIPSRGLHLQMSACLFLPAGLAEMFAPSVLGCPGLRRFEQGGGLSCGVKGQPYYSGSKQRFSRQLSSQLLIWLQLTLCLKRDVEYTYIWEDFYVIHIK